MKAHIEIALNLYSARLMYLPIENSKFLIKFRIQLFICD